MKKVLSILLSLCLIFTSISCVLTQSVSAEDIPTKVVFNENTILGTPVEDVSAFYNADNWYRISNDEMTAKCIFDESYRNDDHRTVATALTDGTGDKNGDNKALQISNHYTHQVYVPFTVKKNTNYRFSFYAKCYNNKSGNFANNSGIANSTFNTVGALAPAWKTTADGIHEYVTQTAGASYQSLTGKMNEFTATPRITPVVGADWVEISYTFNSQDNTDFYFFFRGSTSGSAYYFDEFQLLEDYYNPEDILFWGRYKYSSSDTTYNTLGGTPGYGKIQGVTGYPISGDVAGSIGYNTRYTDVMNDTDDDTGCSMWSYGNNRHYTLTLPTLKPNTKYKLSFYHAMYNKGGNITTNQTMYHYIVNNTTTLTNAGTATTHFNPSPLVHTGKITISQPFTNSKAKYTYEFETNDTNYNKPIFGMYTSYSYNYYDYFVLEEYVETNVSFNSNGGSEVETISGYAGEALTLPTEPTKAGYEFAGWYTDNETFANKFTADTFPAADVTLYAKWDKVDPFEDISNWAIYHGTAASGFTSTPIMDGNNTQTKRGNTEVEIVTDATEDGSKCVSLYGNTTLAAVKIFGLKPYTKYTISLKYFVPADTLHGSNKAWFAAYVIKKDTPINMDSTQKNQPKTDDCVVFERPPVTVREDGSSYALGEGWEDYTLEFTTDNTTDYFFGVMNLLAAKNKDETSPNYDKGGKFGIYYDDITLTQGASMINVNYETNGGSTIDSTKAEAGVAMELPEEPTKDGKVFAGWYTDETLTTAFDGVAKDSDFTLYADWADYKFVSEDKKLTSHIDLGLDEHHTWASYNDRITLSFEYRIVKGQVSTIYVGNSVVDTHVSWPKAYTKNEDGTYSATESTANGMNINYTFKNKTATETWAEFSVEYSVCTFDKLSNWYIKEDDGSFRQATLEDVLRLPVFHIEQPADSELYLRNVSYKLNGATNSIFTAYNNAAAVATSKLGKTGVRVYNEINKAWIEDRNIVEFGSLVTYAELLGDKELVVGTDVKHVNGVAYSKDGNISKLWSDDGVDIVHTSLLINVPAEYFGKTIVVRSYAKDADGNVFYGFTKDTKELCVYDVVNAIDNGSQSDIDTDAFYSIYVTDTNHDAYKAWCEANEKTLGTLYTTKYGA